MPRLPLLLLLATVSASAQNKPNVLFIAVDDLRPTLGCYGDKTVISPNIDRFASTGTLFLRAYTQQAVCSPSRHTVLTGKRPDTIGIYDLATHLRSKHPDVVTLPQYFKSNGYHTEAMGKIFHIGQGNHDDGQSWSIPSLNPNRQPQITRPPAPGALANQRARQQPGQRGPASDSPDVADNELPDGKIADIAVERLGALKEQGKPFFLAVGFLKPHLPFISPKKYWETYQRDQFKLYPFQKLPEGAPPYAGHPSGELRAYRDIPAQGAIPDDMQLQLIHGYHAAITYMDAQFGRVLAELDRLKLSSNTIVILWGDHGWQLGEHGLFCKHSNFEAAVHSPLILRLPNHKSPGSKSPAFVEFADIFPTLADAAKLPIPSDLEGTSFVPLTENPNRPWKSAAFSQYPRNIPGQGAGMGRSIRTDRYRLTEWTVKGKDFSAVELYDYQSDPMETVNLAAKPENEKLVAELKQKLHAGWKGALP